jgi:hypothetical protein
MDGYNPFYYQWLWRSVGVRYFFLLAGENKWHEKICQKCCRWPHSKSLGEPSADLYIFYNSGWYGLEVANIKPAVFPRKLVIR